MNPTYEHISINQVVSRVKVQLSLEHTTDYDNFIEMMLYEAMGSLGLLSQMKKDTCPLSITNGIAKLPDNFVKLIAIRADITTTTNDPITNQISQCGILVYADTMFMDKCGCGTTNSFGLGFGFGSLWFPFQSFRIQNGFVHLNNCDATVTNAHIAYYGTNVDEHGKAIIFSRYERALANYAMWMFTLKYFKDYHEYMIEKYESIWKAQKSMLRAQDVRFSFETEAREIQNILGALCISKAVNFTNS